jgi:hypothetical protein
VRLRTATVLLAALGLLTTGCSDDKKPQTLPSLTPTPTATTAPVVIPSAATVHDAYGAAAFVRFYFAQLNVAFSTADPTAFDGLVEPSCSTCKTYRASAEQLRAMHQRIMGDSIRVVTAEAPPEQDGRIAVDVMLSSPPRKVLAADGSVLKNLPQGKTTHRTVIVQRVTAGWRILGIAAAT